MYKILVSSLKELALYTTIYLIGNYNFSVLWVVIPTVWFTYKGQKSEKDAVRRDFYQALNDHGEQQVLRNLPEMPAWVYFPDFEKAEWVNRITHKLWPYINKYAKVLVRDSIEPMLEKTLSSYQLKGFKFDRINLGSQPLRVGGIKSYSIENQKEIFMDIDVTYAGDSNFTFNLLGFKCGIRNFELYGELRVFLKPLLENMPFVGGVQAYFRRNPKIDFDFFGTAQVLDTPAIKETVKQCVSDIIASMMVDPNKYYIQLTSHQIQEATVDRPQGVLRVHLLEAKNLLKKDFKLLKQGKSDPYTILRVGKQENKSETIDNTVDPKWDEWFEFSVSEVGLKLTADLWDKDATDDEFLGSCMVDIDNVKNSGEIDTWIELSHVKHGSLHLRLFWVPLTSDSSVLETALTQVRKETSPIINSSVITVVVGSASNIQNVKSNKNPDPYVIVEVCKATAKSKVEEKTKTPCWDQGFTFFVRNPTIDKVHFRIMDSKTGTELGTYIYEIRDILNQNNLEIVQQSFQLQNGVSLVLSMYLRIYSTPVPKEIELTKDNDTDSDNNKSISRTESMSSRNSVKNQEQKEQAPLNKQDSTVSNSSSISVPASSDSTSGIEQSTFDEQRIRLTIRYSQQRQRLVIIVHEVENIPVDSVPSVYVKLYLLPDKSKESKRKTKIIKNNTHPIYDEKLEYVIAEAELPIRTLEISVIDDKVMKNVTLGQVCYSLQDFNLNETVSEWFKLNRH